MTEQEAQNLLADYPLPWTLANLGEEKYCKLAVQLSFFNSPPNVRNWAPDLSPPDEVVAAYHAAQSAEQAAKKSKTK